MNPSFGRRWATLGVEGGGGGEGGWILACCKSSLPKLFKGPKTRGG